MKIEPVWASDFEEWWHAYPNKGHRDWARSSWDESGPPIEDCMRTLQWQCRSDFWVRDLGKNVPWGNIWIEQAQWLLENPEPQLLDPCKSEGDWARLVDTKRKR